MANAEMQAESAPLDLYNTITTLAQEIQTLTGRVRHLLAAIDHANDEASFPDVDRPKQLTMLDRVLVFCAMADAATKEAQDKAEAIEAAMTRATRQAAAEKARET